MLTDVEIMSERGETLSLALQENPEGYLVKEIEGLDPVKATLVSSSFANMDGEQYQASRRDARNIVFRLGMVPDYAVGSVRELRARLYTFFMPKSEVRMRFISDDMPIVEIQGRVETFNAPLFSADPEANISIMCFLPDFVSIVDKVATGASATDTSVAPFEVDYDGSVDTGLIFRFEVGGTLSNFKLVHNTPSGMARMLDFSANMVAGDIVEINTIPGQKAATLIGASVSTPMLYGVSPYSDWIRLEPGLNMFTIYTPGNTYPYSFHYTEKYGGL